MEQQTSTANSDARASIEGASRQHRALTRGLLVILLALILWFGALVLQMSRDRTYAVDEFAYAHGAWLVAHGEVPARDFFETKFPLHLWLLSPVFHLAGDDPLAIAWLRVAMLGFLAVMLAGAAAQNLRLSRPTAALTVLLLLSSTVFVLSAVEIRPDAVALAFLMASLAVIRQSGWSGRRRGLLAGLLFGLCLWGTAKALVYGLPFFVCWLIDAFWNRRRARPPLLGAPLAFATGAGLVALGVAGYLTWTGSWADFHANTIAHNQQFVTGRVWRSWWPDVAFVLEKSLWLHPFAALGVVTTAIRVARSRGWTSHPDLLLLLLIPSTFASHALQLYPFRYSLLPFMVLYAVFAARGVHDALGWLWRRPEAESAEPEGGARFGGARLAACAVVGLLAAVFVESTRIHYALRALDNTAQRELLEDVVRLSEPQDPIYDNSASYVARPHAYRMPWTDVPIRTLMADQLEREVPAAISESGCTIAIIDDRFHGLPTGLQRFVLEHFHPYSTELRLWGRRYESAHGRVDGEFRANRSASYFIEPAEALAAGELRVDGLLIHSAIFELERGIHQVQYTGDVRGFHILWLPRNGARFTPRAPDDTASTLKAAALD